MITAFTIGMSRTINLGNFESMRIEASVTSEINEGDSYDAALVSAQRELRRLLEETFRHQNRKKEEQIERA